MENKKKDCPCSSTYCSRHGNCEKCRDYHHSNGSKTTCEKGK